MSTLEELGGYRKVVMPDAVSDCPYCGLARHITRVYSVWGAQTDLYMIEHDDETAALGAGCPHEVWEFSSVRDALSCADMRSETHIHWVIDAPYEVNDEGYYACSKCGYPLIEAYADLWDTYQAGYANKPFDYCPHCGAKVVGE